MARPASDPAARRNDLGVRESNVRAGWCQCYMPNTARALHSTNSFDLPRGKPAASRRSVFSGARNSFRRNTHPQPTATQASSRVGPIFRCLKTPHRQPRELIGKSPLLRHECRAPTASFRFATLGPLHQFQLGQILQINNADRFALSIDDNQVVDVPLIENFHRFGCQ